MRKVVSVAFAVVAATALTVGPALADGPGVGTATVVSVGDSAISAVFGPRPSDDEATRLRQAFPEAGVYFDNPPMTCCTNQPGAIEE